MRKNIKRFLIVIVFVLSIFLFAGSQNNYTYSEFKVKYNEEIKDFQLIINTYQEYIEICDQFNLSYEYEMNYFENDSLIVMYRNLISSTIYVVIEKIEVTDQVYIITITEEKGDYISYDMNTRIYFIEESKEVINDVKSVEVIKNI